MKKSEIKNCIKKFLDEIDNSIVFSKKIKGITKVETEEDVKDLIESGNSTILGIAKKEEMASDLLALVDVFEEMKLNDSFKKECAEIMNVDVLLMHEIIDFANEKLEKGIFELRELISEKIKKEKIKKGLEILFYELSSSYSFAESASISGDFDIEDMPEVVMRGKIILLNADSKNVSDENKEYEIDCLKDMFGEMECSYSFACECAETMDIDIDDMPDFVSYVLEKLKV